MKSAQFIRKSLIIALLPTYLISCTKSPDIVNNTYVMSDKKILDLKEKQKNAFLDNKKNTEKLQNLDRLISEGRLTLDTKKLLKNIVFEELAKANELEISDVLQFASESNFQTLKATSWSQAPLMEGVLKDYKKQREENEQSLLILRGTQKGMDLLYDTASLGLAGTGLGLAGSLAVQTLKVATNQGLDSTYKVLDSEMKKRVQIYFENKINQIPASNLSDLNSTSKQKPDVAEKNADEFAKSIARSFLPDNLSAEERQQSLAIVSGYISRAALSKAAGVQSQVEKLNESEAETKQQILALSKTMHALAKSTTETVSGLAKTQEKLLADIDIFASKLLTKDSLDNLNPNIAFLKKFLSTGFSQQELEKLAELQINSNQKQLVLEQQKFTERINKYINNAGAILQIAKNFGLDKNILNDLSRIHASSQKGFQAYNLFKANNYLEAAAVVSSLFGSSGMNLEDNQHQETMAGLNKILEGQRTIIENQMKLGEAINHVISNQAAEFSVLQGISDQVQNSTLMLYSEMLGIKLELGKLNFAVETVLLGEINSCRILENIIFRDQKENQFRMFSDLSNEVGLHAIQCASATNRLFESRQDFAQFYIKQRNKGSEVFEKNTDLTYLKLIDFVNSKSEKLNLISLLNPVPNTFDLLNKIQYLEKDDQRFNSNQLNATNELSRILSGRINTQFLTKSIRSVINTLPFMTVFKNSKLGQNVEIEKMVQLSTNHSRTTERILNGALQWIQAAVIQETLLTGDIALELMDRDLDEISKSNSDCRYEANSMDLACVIQNNATLSRNFITYILRKDLQESGVAPMSFNLTRTLALNDRNTKIFKTLNLKHNWNFEFQGAQLIANLGPNLKLVVPTNDELLRADLQVSPALEPLLTLQKELVQLLTEINMVDKVQDKSQLGQILR